MVRCSIFKLLVFQILVAWCGGKHVPRLQIVGDVEREVQDSIRNLVHTGIYSHRHLDPTQTQVVTPVKVTHGGEHISHEVDHAHAHGHARARRDLHMREHELPHELHYNLTVDGKEIRLDLRPSVTFITPAMIVERHSASQRTRDRPFLGSTACHYTGSVRGQAASSVALSACDGLDFKSFLRSQADLLESLGADKSSEQSNTSRRAMVVTSSPVHGNAVKPNQRSKVFSNHCPLCKETHYINQCTKFLALNVTSRIRTVKRLGLCSNCLGSSHAYPNCRASHCRTCKGKHHTLLHIPTNPNHNSNQQNTEQQIPTPLPTQSTLFSSPTVNETPNPMVSLHTYNPTTNNTKPNHNQTPTNNKQHNTAILPTALVNITDANNQTHTLRALLDSGSQSNFITESAFEKLKLPKKHINMQVLGFCENVTQIKYTCNLNIQSRTEAFSTYLPFFIVPLICKLTSYTTNIKHFHIPDQLKLADESFFMGGEVDMILGSEIFYSLLCNGQHQLGVGLPMLQNTRLGWVVAGSLQIPTLTRTVRCNFVKTNMVTKLTPEFWGNDSPTRQLKAPDDDNIQCERVFQTHTRNSDGSFVVNLPLKEPVTSLGQSRHIAYKRFKTLESKFSCNPEFKENYVNFMREFESSGHMITQDKNEPCNYLPHHAVINLQKTTTPLRVVIDASSKTSSGKSLNDLQYKGSVIQDELVNILLRFRKHKFVLCADIEKMYRMIHINPNQYNLQAIFWRENPNQPLRTYNLTTLSFGLKCAPYIATRCLLQLSQENRLQWPDAAAVIASDFYMDDLLYGGDNEQKVAETAVQVSRILSSANFNLRKWKSNSTALLYHAGLLRTEHGEYWIEPSNQLHTDSSAPRPHVIFKRSAVDKVAAYHRAKRSLDRPDPRNNLSDRQREIQNRRLQNEQRRNRMLKEARDKRRREYIEDRRRRLEAMRRNPTEYRAQQMKLRMEQRRANTFSKSASTSSSDSGSYSIEQQKNNNRNGNKMSKEYGPRRIRPRRRRRRRSAKNCATKQPPYQWRDKNTMSRESGPQRRNNRLNKNRRNHYQLSQRADGWRRATRSVSKPRHVEVLLVADQSMSAFHNQTSLETYLLTIMNIVSSLYMDPSIGNYIKVVVVKIILLEEVNAAANLEVSTNADSTLSSFCRWQHQLNPEDDENPHHHDVAILVTRQDICSQHDTPCSTLGVAHVAGMCKPDRSCSVNEDNGIMLAHTITHELGHNFGLYHDTEKIGCHRRDGATLHIMTPVFEADTVQVAWSRCSKRDVTNFLDAGLGECLSDKPSQEEYTYPEVPAGVTFDAATQCHLQFGSEAIVCAKPTELCEILWCSVNNTCKTMLRAAAPGTTCGPDMWCQNQTCVPRSPSPTPVDGGWGAWSEWSECSRTCGAGVSTQARECNNPPPENNGAYCIGDRSRYKVCNTDPCPINEPTFREVQCAKYNNITYHNETIADWIPYFDQDKPCELHCVPRNGNDVELVDRGFVADGTPCRQSIGSRDMCIAGVCYKVGCDWIVNSNVEEDACGVCGGDGSACKTVQGIYSKDTTKKTEFSLVAVIPAGSRNVKIQEKASPGNFISIRSARTKKMYLNGAQNAMLTEYFVAGSQAIYERDRDWEKVRISGPIADDIKVYQRIKSGKLRNPGVTYQYTVDRAGRHRRFRYKLSPWSACNVACGDGYARRTYDCIDEHDRPVDQSLCYHMEPPRHEALLQRCRAPCAPPSHARAPPPAAAPPQRPPPSPQAAVTSQGARTHWWVSSWKPCSKPCHMPGKEATKRRSVYCVDKVSNNVVQEHNCDTATKPITTIKCADVPAC